MNWWFLMTTTTTRRSEAAEPWPEKVDVVCARANARESSEWGKKAGTRARGRDLWKASPQRLQR